MAHLILENVRFGYPGKLILEDVSCRFDEQSRVGLVGRNGTGKTTLFRLIEGELEPDAGRIHRSKGLRVGYLRQGFESPPGRTLEEEMRAQFADLLLVQQEMETLAREFAEQPDDPARIARYGELQTEWERRGGYTHEQRIEKVLQGLGFVRQDFSRPIASFSGGERNRAALAAILLSDPNLLLLDEPTNHLDIAATEWLEQYLSGFKGGYVVVSHDRYFLDRISRVIIEIDRRRLVRYVGNYSSYVEQRRQRLEKQRKEYERQQEFIARTEDFIRRNIEGQKTKQAQSRRKMLEKLERIEAPVDDTRSMALRFRFHHQGGRIPVELHGVGREFDSRWIIRDVELRVERGDKIGVIGANGSGKSTLLRMIAGRLHPSCGEIVHGHHVQIGYYDQHLRDLDPRKSVLDDFWSAAPELTREEARSVLGAFQFSGDDVFKRVAELSGGESARLSLAKLMRRDANLLLLDEPTNHLDIISRQVLEDALKAFPGTVIMVTHDRFLLDAVVTKIWSVEDGRVHEHFGTYSELRRRREREAAQERERRAARGRDAGEPRAPGRRLSKRELRRARARQRERSGPSASTLEQQIYQLEDEIHAVQLTMERPEFRSDWQKLAELSETERELTRRLEETMARWEAALQRERDAGL